jgi:hypothetical protein
MRECNHNRMIYNDRKIYEKAELLQIRNECVHDLRVHPVG